jgi:hypothetical protein
MSYLQVGICSMNQTFERFKESVNNKDSGTISLLLSAIDALRK